ncbi:KAT8 regulatory NSL complex subunit 1-like [Hemiscyllium ocellatum]|uniref:KAT8 regulatory NSL complex subunit 1-like n=1 Tax=Hemiscyllium ocellatum TaxID=170820 RepID=UPI002967620B|nr:KAT8 regulatory NSL complex subunit 1-like [Hemiscyllium ocellatum]
MAAGRLKRMVSPAVSESAGEVRQQQHGFNLAVSSSPLPLLSSSPPSAASSPPSSSATNGTLDEGVDNNKNNKVAGPLYFSVDRMDSLFLARPTRVRQRPEPQSQSYHRGERCTVADRGGDGKGPETNNYNHHNHHNHFHHSPHRRYHRHHLAGEPQELGVSSTEIPGLGLNREASRLCGKRQDRMNSDGFLSTTVGEGKKRGKAAISSTASNGLAKEVPCLSREPGLVNGSNKASSGCGIQRSNGAISLNSALSGKGSLDKSRCSQLQKNSNTATSELGLLSKGSSKIPGLAYGCRSEFHASKPAGSSLKSRSGEINPNCMGTDNQIKKHIDRINSTFGDIINHHNNCNSINCNTNGSRNNSISQDEVSAQSLLVIGKQAEIRSRAHRLCKRLQVVQAKQVERHAQQQLAGLVEHSLKQFSSSFTETFLNSSNNKHRSTFHGNNDLPVGSSLLRSFPRTDSKGGNGDTYSSPSSSLRSGGSSKCLLSSPSEDTFSSFVKGRAVSESLLKLVSSVTAKLRTSERAFDSDATESSSGGETDPEDDTGGAKFEHRHATLHRRSEWRWAMERAAIVNRWTWLQAQVSDLEYRIRQQTDIYRQIRANKGPVILGEAQLPEDLMKHQCRLVTATSAVNSQSPDACSNPSSTEGKVPIANKKCELSPCSPSLLLRNIDKQSSRLTQSLGNLICPSSPSCSSPSNSSLLPKVCTPPRQLNGLLNSLHSSPLDNSSLDSSDTEEILCKRQRLDSLTVPSSPPDNSCVAARVRPVRRYRKRRLVRSNLACYLGRKAQRPLSIKCSCDWPNVCILCGSKTLIQTMDQPSMSPQECVAIMEPCYHPILSLPQDIPLHVHFEGLLKQEEHQKPSQKFKSLKSFSQVRQRPQDTAKKVCQKLASSLLTSAKYVHSRNASEKVFKQRLDFWQPTSKTEIDPFTEKFNTQIKKQKSSVHLALSKRHKAASSSSPSLLNSQTPKPSSTIHHSPSFTDPPSSVVHNQTATTTTSTPSARKRRGESSFDINNIVIPMSMAAAARVEKLQYKEILTPSWRIVDVEQSKLQNCKLEEDQYEEMSDEAFLNRHSKCEEIERSRWCLWSSTSSARRGSRSSNKADGRSTPQLQQANAATPHPASPDSGFHLLNDYPHTPSFTGPVSPDTCSSLNSFSSKDRLRVLSINEDTRSSTPEVTDEEVQMVQPWEPRIFPLSAEEMDLLKGHTNSLRENRYERPRNLHWLSANNLSIRTESAECVPSLLQSPRGSAYLQEDSSSDLRLTLATENERSMDR